eukprot:GHVO01011716.1.p1 GENE.GHVO01011716.1~~GHVO01011716.1.p1  ORF type:complete len:325 (-),score=35.06 GHVO01011716.1:588-1538(-)
MDGNKDEAVRCRVSGASAFSLGDNIKALRLLEKSQRMFPTEETQELIGKVRMSMNANSPTSENSQIPKNETSSVKSQPPSREPPASPEPVYTKEQSELCLKVLKESDYYRILDVERDAPEDALKRAYKKLALQLHPDKNSAPHAEEAFKKIARVFQTLNDSNKRMVYDRYGSEEEQPQMRRHDHGHMSPEELFAAFFGMGIDNFGNVRVVRREQRRGEDAHPGHHRGGGVNLTQLLPVLILIFLSLLGGLFTESQPKFSLSPYSNYPVEIITQGYGVSYYVPHSFIHEYPEKSTRRLQMEREVEVLYYENQVVESI